MVEIRDLDEGVERGREMMGKRVTRRDFEELKGCLDLGFGFSCEDVPGLSNTLPALELCYAVILQLHPEIDGSVPRWTISKPGDDPEEVKARLRLWAQAVACIARIRS
ncbi:uncharacterized protein LOC144705941 [Wolffia australiana]